MKKMRITRRLYPAPQPALRFSPYAWAKLLYLRDRGDTEIGGFAICRSEDLLQVDDIQLVRQFCSVVTVEFDDEAVADFVDRQVDDGLTPQQFFRIWAHTHPGTSATPSRTDESTFERVFGRSDWALMFVLAQEGNTYARLRFNVGPGGNVELPVEVDYSLPFAGSDIDAWEEEYLANVHVPSELIESPLEPLRADPFDPFDVWRDAWHDYLEMEERLLSDF